MKHKKEKKKILFISTRNPFSGRYSGDVLRSLKIIKLFKTKYDLDIACLKKKNDPIINEKNTISFDYPNFFVKIFNCIISFLKLKPIHFGLFFSKELNKFLDNNCNNYDYLFFYHIRSSQYLPKDFTGKTIIEMGDLYSENYKQTFEFLSILNPFKYIYYLESLFVNKLEKKIFLNFDKVILFSKNEIKKTPKFFKKKIFQIDESIEKINKKFFYSNKNSTILFIGNMNYLPNFLACKDFIKNVLPEIKKEIPTIKLRVIGDISSLNKIFLSRYKNVEVLGAKKDLSKYITRCFCGLANLEIATGVQGKVLTYMSYGLPVISSKKVASNFSSSVISYNSNEDLLESIKSLKKNKNKSEIFSKKSLKFSKNLIWNKVSLKYIKLFNF